MNIESLKKIVKPGQTLYTVCTHVAKSGMSRDIKVLTVSREHGKIIVRNISSLVCEVLNWKRTKDFCGVKVSGCGMDMGFHTVVSIAQALGYNTNGGKPVDGTNAYGLNHQWI